LERKDSCTQFEGSTCTNEAFGFFPFEEEAGGIFFWGGLPFLVFLFPSKEKNLNPN
jgi:hypothetical protein